MHLEWRTGEAAWTGWSASIDDASAAVRIVDGMAGASRYGEYRLRLDCGRLIHTTAALIRAWAAAGGPEPAEFPLSRWKRERQRAMAVEALMHGLRGEFSGAVARGLLPRAAARMILRDVEAAIAGRLDCDDVAHGPLALPPHS